MMGARMMSRTIAAGAESVQIRRISWAELYRLRPDLKPDNDNVRQDLAFLCPVESVNHRSDA